MFIVVEKRFWLLITFVHTLLVTIFIQKYIMTQGYDISYFRFFNQGDIKVGIERENSNIL